MWALRARMLHIRQTTALVCFFYQNLDIRLILPFLLEVSCVRRQEWVSERRKRKKEEKKKQTDNRQGFDRLCLLCFCAKEEKRGNLKCME